LIEQVTEKVKGGDGRPTRQGGADTRAGKTRQDRLAAALRVNLLKRKAQAAARNAAIAMPDEAAPQDISPPQSPDRKP
jgi:hypothetical protein